MPLLPRPIPASRFIYGFALLFNTWFVFELYRLQVTSNWESPFAFFGGLLYLFVTFYITGFVSAIVTRHFVPIRLILLQVPALILWNLAT